MSTIHTSMVAMVIAIVLPLPAFSQDCDPTDLLATRVNYAAGFRAQAVAMGDLDGDGDADLAVANRVDDDASVLLNNGDGTFAPAVSVPAGEDPHGIALGDVDGDGNLDMVFANTAGGARASC